MFRVLFPIVTVSVAGLALASCSIGHFAMPLSAIKSSDAVAQPGKKSALGGPSGQNTGARAHGATAVDGNPVGPAALDLINAHRLARGLQPLTISPELTRAAQLHAADLAQRHSMSHFGANGSSPIDRVRGAGYRPKLAAENVASGQATIGEAIISWRQSETHDRNLLLPDATHMGIALAHDLMPGQKPYWTLVIAAPL